MSDGELERIKHRRLIELHKRVLLEKSKKEKEQREEELPPRLLNRDVLNSVFVGRSWEIYNAAQTQFPQMFPQLEEALVEAIKTGKIGTIKGEELYHFFREIGIHVRLQTKIRYSEKGKLKTLEEKIKGDVA